MRLTKSVGLKLFFPLLLVFSPLSAQQLRDQSVTDDIAISGYSVVSYFEKGIAERGKPEFSSNYGGKTYYFVSAEQVGKFSQDPGKYKPLFDICPYSLILGRQVSVDPTRFKIVAGHLLLFHYSEDMDALQEWNKKNKIRVSVKITLQL
jgi:YHS domain-containing protein